MCVNYINHPPTHGRYLRRGPTCPHSPGIQRGGGQRPKLQRIRTGGLLWLGQCAGGKVFVRSLLLHKAMRCLKPGPHFGVHCRGRTRRQAIGAPHRSQFAPRGSSPYLRPVQSDPLRWARLVVARLLFDGSVSQTVGVLQRLLLSRADLSDAQHRPRPHAAIARLRTLRPVTDEPPGRAQLELQMSRNTNG